MAEQNKDWVVEEDRIAQILEEIKKKMKYLEHSTGGLKEDIIGLRNTFWDDIRVNLDEPNERAETFSSIKQQAEILSERERSHRLFHKQLKTLVRLKDSPYFGRVDFLEKGERNTDKIYLGIASLMDEHDENFLIYDWRAPISSLYYDHTPGNTSYKTMEGTIEGIMELKRQFIIRRGQMKSMFDTGVTIGDELLKEVLSNNSDTQMKSIVATIQKEQNQIIRNEGSTYLIVQGVAGSGKTSAALQRVAYLLYQHRTVLSSKNIILFSPNPLFNSYVSTVLPELGEENMEQTTFQEYLEYRIGDYFYIEDPFTQMEYLLTNSSDSREYDISLSAIRYKASLDFKEVIDEYIGSLAKSGLSFNDLKFKGETFISADEITSYFYSLRLDISIPNRITLVVEWLLNELSIKEKQERKKDWVTLESELLDREDYLKIFKKLQKQTRFSEDTFDDFDREQKLIAKVIVSRYFKPLKDYVKELEFIAVDRTYLQLFNTYTPKNNHNVPENWQDICKRTSSKLMNNELAFEDATPFLYFQDQLEGQKSNSFIRHLFIDEAQDYSPFQLAYIKQLFPKSKMTILGDVNQAIYPHSINAPTLLSSDLYQSEKVEKITLTQSYRSTKQIINFSKEILEGGELIKPFNRTGNKPTLREFENKAEHKEMLLKQITRLQEDGHETIAIICKTAKESKEVFEDLKDQLAIRLMKKDTSTFEKGLLILPTYLAKGIEFDAVIIYNASDKQYHGDYERNLFYTACTRAMHELHLFSLGPRSRFFTKIDSDSYELL